MQLIADQKCAPYYIVSTAGMYIMWLSINHPLLYCTLLFLIKKVAHRCVPTFANLSEIVMLDNLTNFNTSMVPNLGLVLSTVSLADILEGTL